MANTPTVVHVPRNCKAVVALSGSHTPRVTAMAANYSKALRKLRSRHRMSTLRPILLYVPRAQETYVY